MKTLEEKMIILFKIIFVVFSITALILATLALGQIFFTELITEDVVKSSFIKVIFALTLVYIADFVINPKIKKLMKNIKL